MVRLTEAVCPAFDRFETAAPATRLEAVMLAYLDRVAQETDAHRTLLFCTHLLDQRRGDLVRQRHAMILETMIETLAAAVPELAERPGAPAALLLTLRDLLSPAREWASVEEPEARRTRARRIVGMMLAAARAEAAERWAELGPAEGAPLAPRRVQVESRDVRVRIWELLDAVADGAEVVVTRRGVPAARLVGVRAAAEVHPASTGDLLVGDGSDVHRGLADSPDGTSGVYR